MSEFASQTVQNFDPVNQFKLHMCGFAYYKDEPQRQVPHKLLLSFFFATDR
jgi:hypothetical protein